jgi:hypothetical protein
MGAEEHAVVIAAGGPTGMMLVAELDVPTRGGKAGTCGWC